MFHFKISRIWLENWSKQHAVVVSRTLWVHISKLHVHALIKNKHCWGNNFGPLLPYIWSNNLHKLPESRTDLPECSVPNCPKQGGMQPLPPRLLRLWFSHCFANLIFPTYLPTYPNLFGHVTGKNHLSF